MRIVHRDDPSRVLFEDQARSFETSLKNAVYQGVDLSGANLGWLNLSGATLWGAHLQGADLREATLARVVFVEANLKGASLEGANLVSANLRGADLTSVKWDEHTDFDSVQVSKETKMGLGLALHLGGHSGVERLFQELKHYLEEGRIDQARRVFRQIPGMYPKVEKPPEGES